MQKAAEWVSHSAAAARGLLGCLLIVSLSIHSVQNLVTDGRHTEGLAVNWDTRQALSLATAVPPSGFWMFLETPAEKPPDHLHHDYLVKYTFLASSLTLEQPLFQCQASSCGQL